MHERNQHNSNGSTIYPCSKCDKHFDNKHELNEHRKEHVRPTLNVAFLKNL